MLDRLKSAILNVEVATGILLLGLIARILFFQCFAAALPVPRVGDESFYYHNSLAIHQLILSLLNGNFSYTEWAQVGARLIGQGFFMPGVSLVLAPLHFITDTISGVRFYMAVVNSILIIIIFIKVRRRFNEQFTLLFTALLATFPILIAFNFAFWGESLAGLVLILTVLHVQDYSRLFPASNLAVPQNENKRMTIWTLKLGFLMVILIYLRQNFILIPPIIAAYMAYNFFSQYSFFDAGKKFALFFSLSALILIVGIVPWSYAVSKKYESTFLLTTNVYINATRKLNPNYRVLETKAFQLNQQYARRAEKTGVPHGEILKQHTRKVLNNLKFTDYVKFVTEDFQKMFFDENAYLNQLEARIYKTTPTWLLVFRWCNTMIWYFSLLVLICSPFCLWRRLKASPKEIASYLLLMSFFSCLVFQVLISVSHGRFYVAFVPLTCFIVAYVLTSGKIKETYDRR